MLAEVLVKDDFHLDLLGGETTGAEGVVFVYELNGDDGFGRIVRDSFADAVQKKSLVWSRGVRYIAELTRHMRPVQLSC
jgi:hypothetical protein